MLVFILSRTRALVTVYVKICLLLTHTRACYEAENGKLTLKVVINQYENIQSEISLLVLREQSGTCITQNNMLKTLFLVSQTHHKKTCV